MEGNKQELKRYEYEVGKYERDYWEMCEYDRLKWEHKCADIDKENAEALQVATAAWQVSGGEGVGRGRRGVRERLARRVADTRL